ncbi:DeoR/GlpR family DNA-binding transcription regulator [Listeria swaminathanii]|uniref:DeoR/GlpR family DNA-binding transcription regulator n=1 Tax=Listeria swaminathanii TaxID=2713501 RepID=A0ABU2IGI6_9LIST|nr:DeoR/GlpR family DNA-binding transcription regulator [Listeria swaminathanii]MDT0017505.1 DeoR/GlpR family DNA-binding transcription regulator [Listeria swaminathanii]MDT0022594.1 DeoR/GlpR family DNA-binding transcription regulator [Listeria swaminathanii]MDT0033558.1 DeoR/GlpR family DNA-binding transcription regulator [Listeria swaminathanii]MDT0052490.1 DeoR/GlpR family DNA-binding transcription regulator [Listeria swaminathanii]MDT0055255.1 DeoR/GlpR family DNA-binding transcription re
MNQKERIVEELKLLEDKKTISQEELMQIFSISKDTARRDILKLVESGLAERYPGGVSQPILKPQIESYTSRLVKQSEQKQAIASAAGNLIKDQMTIYLDVSTTVHFLASDLEQSDLVVVTNSMDNAIAASQKEDNKVYLLGGFFNFQSRVLSGEPVLGQLKQFNFDFAFIGGTGLTEEGVFYSELTDVYMKQEIIRNSEKVYLLIDSTKVNKKTAFKIDFSGIDGIITDIPLPKDLLQQLISEEVEVISLKGL